MVDRTQDTINIKIHPQHTGRNLPYKEKKRRVIHAEDFDILITCMFERFGYQIKERKTKDMLHCEYCRWEDDKSPLYHATEFLYAYLTQENDER